MRILVVEDEVDLAHTLHTGLTAEGYSVDLAHDGRQGLCMARTGEYAFCRPGLMLPGINAQGTLERRVPAPRSAAVRRH